MLQAIHKEFENCLLMKACVTYQMSSFTNQINEAVFSITEGTTHLFSVVFSCALQLLLLDPIFCFPASPDHESIPVLRCVCCCCSALELYEIIAVLEYEKLQNYPAVFTVETAQTVQLRIFMRILSSRSLGSEETTRDYLLPYKLVAEGISPITCQFRYRESHVKNKNLYSIAYEIGSL